MLLMPIFANKHKTQIIMKKIILLALVANVCLWGQPAHATGKSE